MGVLRAAWRGNTSREGAVPPSVPLDSGANAGTKNVLHVTYVLTWKTL